MHYFLQQVAKDFYDRHKNDMRDISIVFPNRRAGLYFRKFLSEELEQPTWSPRICTISDLMQELSGLQLADPIMLIFDLHQVFNKTKGTQEPFDEFYFWGEMLLRDFEEIDKFLINPRDLFQNLASIKSIEDQFTYLTEEQINAIRRFWDTFQVSPLSDEQKDFLSIWDVLNKVYTAFNQLLNTKNYAYEGKVYRTVNNLILEGKVNNLREKYIFVGFNALTPCEKKLFKFLKNQEKAEFYWDYDDYYVSNHEAGKFIRENIRDFPGMFNDVPSKMHTAKKIRLLNTSYDIAQTKVLPELLKDRNIPSNHPNDTAIVLPDEHLLLPVLNSLPGNIDAVNVTMGYPVSVTPAYSLLLELIKLQKNVKVTKNDKDKNPEKISFYYKDVLSVLNHQYIGLIRDEKTEEIIERINKHNKVYVDSQELRSTDFMRNVFVYPDNYKSLSDYLLENYYHFYRILKEKSEGEVSADLEIECVYYVYLMVKHLKEIFQQSGAEITTDTYLRILEKTIQYQSIPYEGEPLSGLQVMGILETRALDFDHLILLSMNEGVFPKSDTTSSFIPYNLRKGFGLPTHEYHDAIYAYYFYRLLQRAEEVTLIYNSSSEGVQTGEMSRFIQQLRYESDFKIEENTILASVSTPQNEEIRVSKTPDVLRELERYNALNEKFHTLSPTALNKFLSCPLKFYFNYIAGIKEPDEIAENVDLPMFGLLLHKALELLYGDFTGKVVKETSLKQLENDEAKIEWALYEAFRTEYFTDIPADGKLNLSGKNILIREIFQKYIKQFVKTDQKFTPFTIQSMEKEYAANVDFKVGVDSKRVRFKGKIDRVDLTEEGIRIIDYKTGKPERNFKDIDHLFESKGNHNALQALLYSMMYVQTEHPEQEIIPGLYFIRELFGGNFQYTLKSGGKRVLYKPLEAEFMEQVKVTLQNLFDPDQDFYQTEDADTCRTCPYNKICRKS
ncbi:MAG: PD-(D/E)XK nuclease family protein [Bacteroidales bacterium]